MGKRKVWISAAGLVATLRDRYRLDLPERCVVGGITYASPEELSGVVGITLESPDWEGCDGSVPLKDGSTTWDATGGRRSTAPVGGNERGEGDG